MAQLQKKFLAANAVDDTKIRLSNNANLRARNNANSADIDIVKVDTSDRILFASIPQYSGTPSAANDIANKAYVDAISSGIKPKQAVRVATTANIVIATALNSGDSIDGITLANGDRVLVKNQTAPAENGIYVVSATPARSTDFDSLTPVDEINGAWVAVQEGTQAGYVFVQYGVVAVLDTDPINFTSYNPVGSLVGGDGITITGSTIDVDLSAASGLEFNAGELQVNLEASNPTLQISSTELGVKFSATTSGLEATASGLAVNTEASNPSLEVNGSGELKVKFSTTTSGLESVASGLAVNLEASNPTLEVNGSGELKAKLDAAGAIESGASGLIVQVDASTVKINGSNNLESLKDHEQTIVLAGGDITNQYVDLSFAAFGSSASLNSISLHVAGGPIQVKTVDYSVSLTGGAGGVTRVTFLGDLATGGAAELIAGDTLVVQYSYLT